MPDFWDRKRDELYPDRRAPVTVASTGNGAWWQQTTGLPAIQPQQPLQSRAEADGRIDGHDVSQAGILKGNAEECPNCPVDPSTGIRGNMYRPTKSSALRCFDCGYIDGRYFGEGQARIAKVEGKSHAARQTSAGGAVTNNFHGNITSVDQAVGRLG